MSEHITPPDATLPVGAEFGAYVITRVVGGGTLGTMYLARHRSSGDIVALKLFDATGDSEQAAKFAHEVTNMVRFRHPNIVRIFHADVENGRPYVVMEPADRGSLRQVLDRARGNKLPLWRALSIAHQIAGALQIAHDNRLVHGNVKPENILITRDGRALLMDTGLAQALVASGLSADFSTLGGANYMSPEQAAGEPVDARSDVYALGAVMREMLVGEQPAQIAELVDKALNPAPKARFTTAYAMQRALHDARAIVSGSRQRKLGMLLFAGLATAIALGGGYWYLLRPRPHNSGPTSHVAAPNQSSTPRASATIVSPSATAAVAIAMTDTAPAATNTAGPTAESATTVAPAETSTQLPTASATTIPAPTNTAVPTALPTAKSTAEPTVSPTMLPETAVASSTPELAQATVTPAERSTPTRPPRLASARTVRNALKLVLAGSSAERWGRPDPWSRGDLNVCDYIDSSIDSGGERLWRFTARIVLKNTSRDLMRFPANSLVLRTRNNTPVPACGPAAMEIAPGGEETVYIRAFFEGDKLTPYKLEMLPATQSVCIVPLGNTANFGERELPFGALTCGR